MRKQTCQSGAEERPFSKERKELFQRKEKYLIYSRLMVHRLVGTMDQGKKGQAERQIAKTGEAILLESVSETSAQTTVRFCKRSRMCLAWLGTQCVRV